MPCSAAGCGSPSPGAGIASGTMPSCWPRPRRRTPGEHVVDLGAGVGAAGLALAARVTGCMVTLVEIDAGLAALAADNVRRNGLADRVRIVTLDVAAPARAFTAAGLAPGSVMRVMMNPPFNDPARQRASPDPQRRLAHVAARDVLVRWIEIGGAAAASARHPHVDLAGGRPRRRAEDARTGFRCGPGAAGPPEGRRARDPRHCSRHQGKPRTVCAVARPFPQ